MRCSLFLERYRITKEKPSSVDSSVIAVPELIKEVGGFLEDNFSGLFSIKNDLTSFEYVRIPLDYLAYLFKLLAVDVHSKTLVNVNFSCDSSNFKIKIEADGGLSSEDVEMRELMRACHSAGFDVKKIKNGLLLTRTVLTSASLSVFARAIIPASSIGKVFSRIFFGE